MNEKATAERSSMNGGNGTVFRFPATAAAPGKAREAVHSILRNGYSELVETSMLLISELVTNCVRHGGLGPENHIEVRIRTYSNGLKFDVVDYGVGFRYEPREGSLDRAGGWGLYMVDQLAHRWGVKDGYPTTVWFELLKPQEAYS